MQVLALWGFFAGLAVGMLLIDILRFMVKPEDMPLREASIWTFAWGSLAALFAIAVFAIDGPSRGLEFITGYALQWTLSVGNVFVFFMIFHYFDVPLACRQRVLFLGILGAMVLRCLFISDAAALLASFSWLIYIFWAFLIWVAIKLLLQREPHAGLRRSLRFCTHIITVVPSYEGENFFVRRDEEWVATALLPVMALAIAADVVFAVDAISASLVISRDTFFVYAFNMLAILGLRALYFLLAGTLGMFRYLQAGLCIVLIYVGVRMLIADFVEVPIGVSLGVVGTVLSTSIGASLLFPPTPKERRGDLSAPTRRTGEPDDNGSGKETRAA